MTPSLSIALPSIHRITKRDMTSTNSNKTSVKQQPNDKTNMKQQSSSQFTKRNHVRTTSAPSALPSFLAQNNKLSMDILLDAIDLDQQMRQFFRSEVVKSKSRTTTSEFNPSHMMMARRRSKSAPGAPPSYHHQRAFSARWITPASSTIVATNASQAQEVAKLIVQQHFEAVKKR